MIIRRIVIVLSLIGSVVIMSSACGGTQRTPMVQSDNIGTIISLSDSLLALSGVDTVDLGRIKEGEVVERQVSIANVGSKPFVILGVETTCGCAQIEFPRQPLKGGESGIMTVRFDSKGQSGWQLKTLYIITSLQSTRYKVFITADVD